MKHDVFGPDYLLVYGYGYIGDTPNDRGREKDERSSVANVSSFFSRRTLTKVSTLDIVCYYLNTRLIQELLSSWFDNMSYFLATY